MRIDAYMQVSQIYQANKTKNAPKTGKAGSRDSLEISSFGNAYQVAKQAASQASYSVPQSLTQRFRHRWQQEPILYQLKMSQTRWQMHCFLNDIGGYTFG